MQVGHVNPTTQQPIVQAPAPVKAAASPALKAQDERNESQETKTLEAGRGEKVNKLA